MSIVGLFLIDDPARWKFVYSGKWGWWWWWSVEFLAVGIVSRILVVPLVGVNKALAELLCELFISRVYLISLCLDVFLIWHDKSDSSWRLIPSWKGYAAKRSYLDPSVAIAEQDYTLFMVIIRNESRQDRRIIRVSRTTQTPCTCYNNICTEYLIRESTNRFEIFNWDRISIFPTIKSDCSQRADEIVK